MSHIARIIALAAASVLVAQEPLTNEGVVKLVRSGMTEDLIVNVIQQQPGAYTLGAADLVALKEAGVSERIISAMLARGRSEASAPAVAPAGVKAAASPAQRSAVTGTGLFYKKGNEYFELLAEDITWKSSGALRHIASAGIVKRNLDGSVTGPSSRNFLTNPTEILFAPPAGITINAYILLPLKSNKGVREFRVGPVNQKSGVARGAIAFGVEKIGDNLYRMVLQTPLSPGEYGIIGVTPDQTADQAGKMYTFRILL